MRKGIRLALDAARASGQQLPVAAATDYALGEADVGRSFDDGLGRREEAAQA